NIQVEVNSIAENEELTRNIDAAENCSKKRQKRRTKVTRDEVSIIKRLRSLEDSLVDNEVAST
ncbi:14158_t:CDS:1, partial [Dentiscutata erythropus]